jgi:hypothetical protein
MPPGPSPKGRAAGDGVSLAGDAIPEDVLAKIYNLLGARDLGRLQPWASLPLSADVHLNVLNESYDRMHL